MELMGLAKPCGAVTRMCVLATVLWGTTGRAFGAAPVLPEKATSSCQFPYPSWKDGSPNTTGRVERILRVGNVIYIGGDITTADDRSGHPAPRHGLAALDAVTGRLLDFAPRFDGRVRALAALPDGAALYVGGEFRTLDGKPSLKLAAFDVKSGAALSLFERLPVEGVCVMTFACKGPDVYIGGNFTSVGGKERSGLARLTFSKRSGRFELADWAPKVEGGKKLGKGGASMRVMALAFDDARRRIIAGGFFGSISGDAKAARLAALDPDTGKVVMTFQHLPNRPDGSPFPFAEVIDIAVDGDTLYVAMGGPGGTALAYNLADGRLKWFYQTDGNVQAVAVVNGYPVFGHHGDFVALKKDTYIKEYAKGNRVERKKLFLLSPDGVLQPWAPRMTRIDPRYSPLGVWTLCVSNGTLYAGGDFTEGGGVEQQRFATFPIGQGRSS